MTWVKFHGELCEGAKRGIPRAVRFILMELAHKARPGRGVLDLPLGMSDGDALQDVLGGNAKEVREAHQILTTGDDPILVFEGPEGARRLRIPSWDRFRPTPQAWSRKAYPTVFRRDGRACRYCGTTASGMTVDHVEPRAAGGGDEPSNLVVACRQCNSRKGARTPEQAGMRLRRLDS